MRYPRGTGPGATVKAHPVALPIGKAEIISDGDEVAIFGLGALLPLAQQLAAELRQQGFSAAVINPRFVKPLDRDVIAEYARRVGVIVTLEDHVLMGGFGSAVLEALSEMQLEVPVVRIGWPDRFIEHGKVDQLRAKYGISVEAAMEKLAPYLQQEPANAWSPAKLPFTSSRPVPFGPSESLFPSASRQNPAAFSAGKQTAPGSASSSPNHSPGRQAPRAGAHTRPHR